jgi:hypothetical protein
MSRSGEELTALAYERLDAIAEAEYLEDEAMFEAALDPADEELMGVIGWAALLRLRWRSGFVNDAWGFRDPPTIRIVSLAIDPDIGRQQADLLESLLTDPEHPDYFEFQAFFEACDWNEQVAVIRDLTATEQAMPGQIEYRAMINGLGTLSTPDDSSPTGYVLEDDEWLKALDALCISVSEFAVSGDERAWDVLNTASSNERRLLALQWLKRDVESWRYHAPFPEDEIGPHLQQLNNSSQKGIEAAETGAAVVEMLTKAIDGKPDAAIAELDRYIPDVQRVILHQLAAVRFCDEEHR